MLNSEYIRVNELGIPATINLYNNDSIYIEFDW